MRLDKLNGWLTLLANIAVFAGLVLVAYVIGQAQRQLELAALADTTDYFTQALAGLTHDPGLSELLYRAQTGFEQLEDFEKWRVFKYLDGFVTMSEHDYLVMQDIGEVDLGGFHYDWEEFMTQGHFRAYWGAHEERFGAEFRAYVNGLLAAQAAADLSN